MGGENQNSKDTAKKQELKRGSGAQSLCGERTFEEIKYVNESTL